MGIEQDPAKMLEAHGEAQWQAAKAHRVHVVVWHALGGFTPERHDVTGDPACEEAAVWPNAYSTGM